MFFIKRTPRLFEHIKKEFKFCFPIFLDLLAHLPTDEGDLLLCEPLLQVHNDGVQGPAITVFDHHLNQGIHIYRRVQGPAIQYSLIQESR